MKQYVWKNVSTDEDLTSELLESGMIEETDTVLCKSNESEFRRKSRFVLIEIRRKFVEDSLEISTCEISWKSAKFRSGLRKIEEAKFRRSEISTNIRAKGNEMSAKFRKIEEANFRTSEISAKSRAHLVERRRSEIPQNRYNCSDYWTKRTHTTENILKN